MSKLLKNTTKGVAWTTLSTIVRNLVYLVQIIVLTRLLSKSDFGIVAIISVFIGFSQIFLDLGISVGILHKQNISKNQYSSLFWLNIISGIAITIILFAIAPLLSGIYNEPVLSPLIRLLSLTILFSAIGSQHKTVQQKNMRFKTMAIIDIISSSVAMITAVFLAYSGYGIYSLIFSAISAALVSGLSYLYIGLTIDKNISFHFSLRETHSFLKIGTYQIGSAILDYFSGQIDVIFIKSAFGNEVLGLYSLCIKVVQIIYSSINPIFTKVLTPLLAKLQSDSNHLKNVYYKIIESLTIINSPVYILVSVFSTGILLNLYGEQYREGGFILSILALYYGILTISNPVGSLQVALGKTKIGFLWTIYRVISTFIVIYIGSLYDLETMVVLLLSLGVVNLIVMWRLQIYVMIKMSLKTYLKAFSPSLLISLIVSIPLYLFFKEKISILSIVIISGIYLITYFLIIKTIFSKSYLISLFNAEYKKIIEKKSL